MSASLSRSLISCFDVLVCLYVGLSIDILDHVTQILEKSEVNTAELLKYRIFFYRSRLIMKISCREIWQVLFIFGWNQPEVSKKVVKKPNRNQQNLVLIAKMHLGQTSRSTIENRDSLIAPSWYDWKTRFWQAQIRLRLSWKEHN